MADDPFEKGAQDSKALRGEKEALERQDLNLPLGRRRQETADDLCDLLKAKLEPHGYLCRVRQNPFASAPAIQIIGVVRQIIGGDSEKNSGAETSGHNVDVEIIPHFPKAHRHTLSIHGARDHLDDYDTFWKSLSGRSDLSTDEVLEYIGRYFDQTRNFVSERRRKIRSNNFLRAIKKYGIIIILLVIISLILYLAMGGTA